MMETATLKIEGMTCNGCVSAVKKALERTDGVSSADVALDTGNARVTYDATRTTPARLRAAVEDAGYDVAA
ncbi:heavy-metal-associated domain-containing protein [Gluconacetobacter azotocaptans]|nr:heavy-metal-associated domain-containing protein [Gluconacetobacter azotocaptans]GBQ28475.1 cation/copper resistance transporter ATPase CopZ [Gluconacetobacter azotocaptans DSM 13594]